MNNNSLDFTLDLEPQEKEYTTVDVSQTMEAICYALEIVEVAEAIWIKLVKLPETAEDFGDYLSKTVYMGDCPRCKFGQWQLRVFLERQTYGCRYCSWDADDEPQDRNVFEFLSYCNPSEYQYEDPLINIKKIRKLLELFPEKVGPVIEANPIRYVYDADFTLAEKYHSGMHNEITQAILDKNVLHNKKYDYSGPGLTKKEDNTLNELDTHIRSLVHIIDAHEIAPKIFARQAEVDRIIYGKSLSEVLWEDATDELTGINYDAQNAWVAPIDSDDEEKIGEVVITFLQEEDENREAIEAEKKAFEIELDENTAEGRAKIAREQAEKTKLVEEAAKRVATEEAEKLRAQKLECTKRENPLVLLQALIETREQQESFFQGKTYDTILEWDTPLNVGDFGKLVLVFQADTSTFSVVFGKNKANFAPPATIDEAECITTTRNIPEGSWVRNHKNISIAVWAQRVGWAQYIVLPNNTILIGGDSGDYGSISHEIARKCLEKFGYTVYFLNNVTYATLEDVYNFLNRE